MFRSKRNLIILTVFVSGVFAVSYFPQNKGVKGGVTSIFNNKDATLVKEEWPKMTAEQRKSYHLTNPFSEDLLMPFALQSDTAIALDAVSGEVLYAKNVDTKKQTASISKIMTAIVTLENSDPETLLEVSQSAADITPNKIVMKAGEKMKIDDLLYGLMMISANDAAEVLAEGVFDDRQKFIDKMNEKAKWLELKNTNFVTPSGLDDPNHYSTPYDLGVITRYALKEHPEILKYMGELEHSVYPSEHNESHWWQHISSIIRSYEGMDGVKTGYTWEAGNTFLGTAKRGDKRVVVILFNSQDSTNDVTSLFNYSFK